MRDRTSDVPGALRRSVVLALGASVAVATIAVWRPEASALADDGTPAAAAGESPETTRAREDFLKGVDLVKKGAWPDALAAFERSAKLHPSAVTTYNIGACQRAMGQYTLARKTLAQALDEGARTPGGLTPSLVTEISGYITQLDGLFATASVTLVPANASISVDGRPLDARQPPADAGANAPLTLVAGIRDPGPAEMPPAPSFKLVLDPGVHLITLTRKGYADAVVNRSFAPGSNTELRLELDRLPATFHIASNPAGGIVTVNGSDVGAAPVDVSRPAGSYRVVVKKGGFVTYEAQVVAQPGEDVNLSAELPAEKLSLTQRWWFWTAAGVVVAGAAAGTYFLTRSDTPQQRPPLDGGGLGWTLKLR